MVYCGSMCSKGKSCDAVKALGYAAMLSPREGPDSATKKQEDLGVRRESVSCVLLWLDRPLPRMEPTSDPCSSE